MKNKTVLITGGTGFTGYHLKERLERVGCKVVGPHRYDNNNFNLTDRHSVKRLVDQTQPDYVVNLAGVAFVDHAEALECYEINVLGAENLLCALAEAKKPVEKVILVSSSNVYGRCQDGFVAESAPLVPVSHYGISKLAMELMAKNWSSQLPIVVARPFNYTGQGQQVRYVIPKIVDHFRRQVSEIQLGNIDIVREFNDVRLVALMYERLLEKGTPGTTINLCTGVGHSLRGIIENLERLSGHSLRIEVSSEFVRKNEIAKLVGDPKFLLQQIGDFEPIPMNETLKWMLEGNE